MERRQFIRRVFGGAAAGLVAPGLVMASSRTSSVNTSSMAGGVYFTEAQPGRWSKKITGHLPNIQVIRNETGTVLKVVTPHEMKAHEHYIVKHIVLDHEFNFIAEQMFDPTKDKAPISEMSVGTYRGVVNVLSVCNKHDTWLNTAEV
jgi:superoxide reductase